MAKHNTHKVRIIFHKGSLQLKFVILVTVILATLTLGALQRSIVHTRQQLAHFRSEAIALEQENAKLSQDIANVNTAYGVAEIARRELGLVSPDTVIFRPTAGN